MVNRWSITNVSRAPGSQGLRDCAREYLIFRCASCYSIFSRVLGNQFARPKFGHTYAQSRLRHGRMHGRRARSAHAGRGFPARVRAPATRPGHPRPSTGPTMRLRACGRISGASARGAARTRAADARRRDARPRPGRERGNSIDATTRLAGRDAGRDETAWPIRLLQSAIDRDRANSYPGALTCTSRGVIILWSGRLGTLYASRGVLVPHSIAVSLRFRARRGSTNPEEPMCATIPINS